VVAGFFALIPIATMLMRLLRRGKSEGLNAMLTPPGANTYRIRPLASRVRSFLYARTSYGQLIDITQALFSGISCALFIVVAYLSIEPEGVAIVEDFFTLYFGIDFILRLWLAQDSLMFYFSLVSVSAPSGLVGPSFFHNRFFFTISLYPPFCNSCWTTSQSCLC
jgi:hypothetical protein